jgi:catechol 2,3-dioxygenase-like lactoylglutathione lyase family enzyme
MPRLDHVALPVIDVRVSKAWYVDVLGLQVEMETDDPPFCGLVDDRDTTLFLTQVPDAAPLAGMAIWYSVDDVFAFHERHGASVDFVHGPQSTPWGFGAEVRDPTGHVVRVWDETSMERGHG